MLKNIAVALSVFAALLLVSEIAARLAGQAPPEVLIRIDPVLGHGYRPNASIRYRSGIGEFSTIIKTNSLGFRDDDHAFEKPPAEKRILVLGDSFVVGREVAYDHIFPRVLSDLLRDDGQPFEVIQTAVAFYSPVKYYLLLKELGQRFQPDIVVMTFCFNDVTEDIIHTNLADLDETGLPLRIRPTPKIAEVAAVKNDDEAGLRIPLKDILKKHSRFYWFLQDRFRMYTGKKQVEEASKKVYDHARSGDIENDYFAVFKESLDESDRAAWKQTARYVQAIHELCEKNGARLLILIVPTGNQINKEEWMFGKQYWKFEADHLLESTMLQERVVAIGDSVGAISLDLLPVFRRASNTENPIYFSLDGHWTEFGHEIAAKSLFEFLKLNDWLVSEQ